jgi:hypothetical protein
VRGARHYVKTLNATGKANKQPLLEQDCAGGMVDGLVRYTDLIFDVMAST